MGPEDAQESGITTRAATLDDFAALADLRYTWRVVERGERPVDRGQFRESFATWMHAHRATHEAFLGFRHGDAIAMAWLAIVERVPGPELFVRRSGYVQSAYVIEPERGGGVGSALMHCVIARASALGLDYLAVHPSERSFSFYERLGFAEATRVLELRSGE